MCHGGQTPEHHGQGVPQTRSQTIYQSTNHYHPDGVRALKHENEVAIVDLVPAQVVLQSRLQNAEDLAVHVVLGYAE
jgi:hypothetical protein